MDKEIGDSYIYLATPYMHSDSDIRHKRYKEACKITAHLLKLGYVVYSPIVHWHMVAVLHELPKDFLFWQHIDEVMLKTASRVFIADMDGWRESEGIKNEMQFCELHDIPYEVIPVKEILGG